MKLAPVRVFSCKHPLILKILFVIDCGETLFFLKTHLEETFFEGGYDVMMIRTSVSESIIYNKEKDNWIINWPTYRYRFPDKFSLRIFFSFCDSQYGRISFLLRDMTFTWRPRAAVLLVSKCVVFQGYLSGMFFLLAQ